MSRPMPIKSILYDEHISLGAKSRLADFAGYLMPLWYSSISLEHAAVREAAGLFDCTHMGVLEISGRFAERFLDFVCTNDVTKLTPAVAQYSYILDAQGNILDDIIIYRRSEDNFMVVVNAANELKIKAYFDGLMNDTVVIDVEKPDEKLDCKPSIRDMRDCSSGADCRVDIALQGPASLEILLGLAEQKLKEQIRNLKHFRFIEGQIAGLNCIISTTGYTGSKVGFELFVHPDNATKLWNELLESGKNKGILPCGLGARDSLRIEAGLPLYGHELAGEFEISPFEAGYNWAVKLGKEFFIGKTAMLQKARNYDMVVSRIELPGQKGVRPTRQHDAVIDEQGKCIGWVLSCAKAGEKQIAICYIAKDNAQVGKKVGMYYLARSQGQIKQGRSQKVAKGDFVEANIAGIIVTRFAKF